MRRGQRSGARDPRKRKKILVPLSKNDKNKKSHERRRRHRFLSYISLCTIWWAHRNGNLLVQIESKNGFETKKWRMGFEVRISTPAPCVSSIHCAFIFDQNCHSEMFCACQVLVSKRYIGGTGPYAGRRTIFNAPLFWKHFENAKNFQNQGTFSSNVGVIQVFSRYGFNSFGLENPKEISKFPDFLGALSGGFTIHESFSKRAVQI